MFGMVFSAFTHILGDLFVFFLPLFIVRSLQLGGREKVALVFVFTIGGMSIIASFVRFGLVYESYNIKAQKKHVNPLDTVHALTMWSAIEIFFGFTAFVLPSLRAVIRSGKEKGSLGASLNKRHPSTSTKWSYKLKMENSGDSRSLVTTTTHIRIPSSSRGSGRKGGEDCESQTELRPWEDPWEKKTHLPPAP
jgi:hypothetical protein